MTWDLLAVIAVITLAGLYLVRRYSPTRGSGCGTCCGCGLIEKDKAMGKTGCAGRGGRLSQSGT